MLRPWAFYECCAETVLINHIIKHHLRTTTHTHVVLLLTRKTYFAINVLKMKPLCIYFVGKQFPPHNHDEGRGLKWTSRCLLAHACSDRFRIQQSESSDLCMAHRRQRSRNYIPCLSQVSQKEMQQSRATFQWSRECRSLSMVPGAQPFATITPPLSESPSHKPIVPLTSCKWRQ